MSNGDIARPSESEMLQALEAMVRTHCAWVGVYDDWNLTANASALEVLTRAGRMHKITVGGRTRYAFLSDGDRR